jgi:hypothetical protein
MNHMAGRQIDSNKGFQKCREIDKTTTPGLETNRRGHIIKLCFDVTFPGVRKLLDSLPLIH